MDGPSRNTLKLSSSKHVRKSREVETDYAPERMGVPVRRSRRRSRSWDSNDSDLEESRRRKNSSRRSEDLKFGEDNYGFEDRSDKGSRKHRRRSLSRSRSSRRSRIKRSRSSSRLRKKHREYRRRSRSRSRERRRRRRSSSRSRRSRRSSSSSISRSPESKPSNFSSNPIQTANFSAPVGSSSFGTGMPISNIAMSSTLPQVTKQARRLYVGSLPMSMPFDEQFLLQYFTTVVQQLGVITPTPIISVWISADRSFCFLEFRSISDCTLSLSILQGVELGGRMLKIGRPAEYAPVPVHLANFVAPIPIGMPVISPGDVFSNSMIDPVSSMAFPSTLNIPIPLSATRCLVLENMLTPEDILNEEEYEDILLDIEEECSQFGKVLKVAVPKDPQDKGFGKAYVLFDDIEGCKTAKSKLHGRLFNMRQVSGKFYDENKFHSADYM